MAVEMVFAKKSFRTYLEVHSQLIPPYLNNPEDALVKITAAGQSTHGIAHRHQGGQRVTLPSQLHDTVVHHLLSGAPVTIELIGYKTTLEPHDFALFYQEAQKAPFNLPIQLPFKL